MINFKHLNYFYTVAKTGAVNRAAEKLHLAPQTLSGQLGQFEDRLGVELFRRTGRRLELTETGRLVLSYAEEIFQVTRELEQSMRNSLEERVFPFRVGIADVVPKSIAYRLLAPALALTEPVHLICREDRLDRLLGELAIHHLDMVLADRPMPSDMDVKGYSHPLGESGVAFFATPELAARLSGEFPDCLAGAPMLIPGEDSALRAPLLRWMERRNLRPRIVGEFDDSALKKVFGKAGAGVFTAALATAADVENQYGVIRLGETRDLLERFFAISVERKVTHPAVRAILEAASRALLDSP
jgi:LysR family transcriptional regulator, transcriptional activator of nhaA